ncbi:hypothetical protein E8E12_001669 [Didymella heteroderae]|uniref:Uncharacterized protein n=1 Tax=Didymella heteroderae TaxID=1769908 RepID=A0A9P4WJG3_9PLEO|nr:hypothetical protein E8E12_001669 [Didymella heteroderae]
MEDKRSSYIRKRASAQSPFFSAGYRASSSSYRSPPAFLTEKQKRSRNILSPSRANTIVKPGDDVEEGQEKEVPITPSPEKSEPRFPGSLRKHRSTKSLAKEAKKAKSPSRPATTMPVASGVIIRRASTRKSLLASELKASLNDLTGSEIYDNADLSESVYTDEEDDIDDYEKRTTVKPGQYTLPPLNLDSRKNALREKRSSKRNSQLKGKDRELKRTSEREPTPHYLAKEHGGKENISSAYALGKITPIPESKVISRAALSPVRPTSSNIARNSQASAIPRKSILRDTQARPVSRAGSNTGSTNERHSRRSLHSRNQSRASGPRRTPRGHSRSQSSAFPFFDPNVTEDTPSIGEAITTPTPAARTSNYKPKASSVSRDLSGNLTYHGDETLGSSSMVFNPPPVSRYRSSNVPSGVPGRQSVGLGLYPSGSSAAELNGERARNPLSVAGASVDVEGVETQGKGRRTWGAGLKSIVGRGSVWGWEKEKDDVKVFV